MTTDRITRIQINGLRALASVELEVAGLNVLIGDNGTGKSTLLEAFELLRLAAKPGAFVTDTLGSHGGLAEILSRGRRTLEFTVEIAGEDASRLVYHFAVFLRGSDAVITYETLQSVEPDGKTSDWLERDGTAGVRVLDAEGRTTNVGVASNTLTLSNLGFTGSPAVRRAVDALARIECHFPFETRPLWQQQELDVRSGPRWPVPYDRHERVARYGTNLASCIQQLRNGPRDSWERLLSRAQLGFGEDLRDLTLTPSGRGNVDLELVFAAWPDKPLPVRALSEGQISYLLMVAMFELGNGRSLLLFDEPELHLHPELLARVVQMFEEESKTCPVIIATQSDQLLDALDDPAKSVVLCEREDAGIVFRRPSPTALARWMERYRGLGTIRGEGFEKQVFDDGERVGAKRP